MINDRKSETGDTKRKLVDSIYNKNDWGDNTLDSNIYIWDKVELSLYGEELFDIDRAVDSVNIETLNFSELQIDISSSSENKINQRREEILRKDLTSTLINCILEEDFEFGITSKSEEIVREQFSINALATRNWLNEIFINYYNDEKILVGILRILGRFDEDLIFPQGQTIALAALSHQNYEINELGIRAFENWNSPNSLKVLQKTNIKSDWLKEYLTQVIEELT